MRVAEIMRQTAAQYAWVVAVLFGCVEIAWAAARVILQPSIAGAYKQARTAGVAVPRLFRERAFTCATLAEAVNHFVALGEDGAVKGLDDLASDRTSELRGYRVSERIGWVCRVLFVLKGQEPLRPPMYGALNLPWESMPLRKWPLYPVALSGSTYFVLSEGYLLHGHAEEPERYIAYCRANGIFRKTPVRVPTRDQALKDSATLRQSEVWRAIKWQVSEPGTSYPGSEEWTWKFIRGQAESIPVR